MSPGQGVVTGLKGVPPSAPLVPPALREQSLEAKRRRWILLHPSSAIRMAKASFRLLGGEVTFQQSTFNDSNSHRSGADLLARATLLLLRWRLAVLWLEELLGLAVKVSSLTSSQDVTLVP